VTGFKRDPIKFVRDKAKAGYKKDTVCKICENNENLEFHHYYTLTPLFNKWLKVNKLIIKTDKDVLAIRDDFIKQHMDELYDHTVTLCKKHHAGLHKVYGKDPALITAEKQKRWVGIQRAKNFED
jgi:hypothetical protein